MTEEKWMTFEELPDGLCTVKEASSGLNLYWKYGGKLYYDCCSPNPKEVLRKDAAFRPIDPKAIEVGELALRWLEWHREDNPRHPKVAFSSNGYFGFYENDSECGYSDLADAFREVLAKYDKPEPRTTLADIPVGKFGAANSGIYYRTPFALLGRISSDQWDVGPWADGEKCTIHDTLEEAEGAR